MGRPNSSKGFISTIMLSWSPLVGALIRKTYSFSGVFS